MKFKFKFLLVALIFCNYSYPQISSKKIDKLVNEAMEKFDVVGAAVAVVKDGKVIHNKGYGFKSIETKEKVNEHTNFAIASNTKAFTSAALAILVDEGKLSWDDEVVDYIPEFRMYNEYVTQNFNITDLLTHRSGLGLGAGDLMFWPGGTDFTIKDILKNFQYFEPQSAFRTKFDYDNLLYMVAGEVINRISGKSWEEFVKTHIIEPLNMDNTYTSLEQISNRDNLATPYSDENGPLKSIPHNEERINGAAGGIYSNVDDLCNWMLTHLNKGKYGETLEEQLFSESNHRKMWKIHTVLNADTSGRYNSHFAGYGLGWGLMDIKGNMSVNHGGYVPGMFSLTYIVPDLNLGIVVLTNTALGGDEVTWSVTKTIIDSYLGLDDFNWIDHNFDRYEKFLSEGDSISTQVWQTVKSAIDTHINADDYIGTYKDNWFGNAEVFLNDEQLWFKCIRSPQLNGPMYYYKGNAFAIKWEYQDMNADAFAIFSLDEEGKAQGIRMKGISPNMDFSFDFQDLDFQRISDQ
jgi:CubicO group peptidase (beta-lactamase class C family)